MQFWPSKEGDVEDFYGYKVTLTSQKENDHYTEYKMTVATVSLFI